MELKLARSFLLVIGTFVAHELAGIASATETAQLVDCLTNFNNVSLSVSRIPERDSMPCSAQRPAIKEHVARRTKTLRKAYVTLLYSSKFVDGARVLGQSLRETGTDADIIVLVKPNFPQKKMKQLAEAGWIIRVASVEATANEELRPDLVRVYMKLLIADLEDDYDRIVFLDDSTLVLENIDELFDCRPFCAVLRHSELLDSSVLVVTPSTELYNQMRDEVEELDSYTGGESDQGFLDSFFPYFAACPVFEPYPARGEGLEGIGAGIAESSSLWGIGAETGRRALLGRDGGRKLGEWIKPQAWGCKRLPTRYNGDWASLFVEEHLRLVQGWTQGGLEAGKVVSEDWQKRKRVKVLNFSFGVAKPWLWWAYPFFPYVDLWLDTFHRLQGLERKTPVLSLTLRRLTRTTYVVDEDSAREARPRWDGAFGEVFWGLAPLAVMAIAWQVVKRWKFTRRALRRTGTIVARRAIPLRALDPTSLVGSVFNFTIGSALTVCAAVLAFYTVPAKRLGALRPEAAWAFFLSRSTALIVLFEAAFLFLVTLKAQQVGSVAPSIARKGFAAASGSVGAPSPKGVDIAVRRALSWAGTVTGGLKGLGKRGGGGSGVCAARRLAMWETLGHLVVVMAFAVSFVSTPARIGIDQAPISLEAIYSGAARLLALIVALAYSAVRLPPVWAAAYARAWDSDSPRSSGHGKGVRAGWRREKRTQGGNALGDDSPLSDQHNA